MTPDDQRHGTPAGYRAHRRAGETACRECLAANARMAAEWNERNPDYARWRRLRAKAARVLVARHHDELRRIIYDIHRAEAEA